MRSVMKAMTTVRNSTEAKENQTLDARPIERFGIDEMGGVIGELDEHGVERLDQHVDGEGAGHGGKTERQAGQRMPSDGQIGDAGERDQDQIARIRRDARQDARRRTRM